MTRFNKNTEAVKVTANEGFEEAVLHGIEASPQKKWRRYVASTSAAGALTFALGVTMALMIETNFTAAEKPDTQSFEINPVAADIAPPESRTQSHIKRDVIVPPPSPRIETASKSLPSEPIVPIGGNQDIDWKMEFTPLNNIISIADSDEQPLYRTEPVMPPRAQRSGHCIMQFDVSAEGAPYNISAQSCSEDLFKSSSAKAVSKWKYKAKVVNGQRTARAGITTRITFNLTDERGNIIPE